MTRQTITYWRWWGMTIATRNDERQGQRVMWRMHAMWDKDEDNEGDATINNQYNDNDKRRLQRGRGKWTSADKEDDKGGWGGHERNTKLRTARENTGYATIITGMTTRQESNEDTFASYIVYLNFAILSTIEHLSLPSTLFFLPTLSSSLLPFSLSIQPYYCRQHHKWTLKRWPR